MTNPSLAKGKPLAARRGSEIASAGSPAPPGTSWVETESIAARSKASALQLMERRDWPLPSDVLCVRMCPADPNAWALTVTLQFDSKEAEERVFEFQSDAARLNEQGFFDAYFVLVHGPEPVDEVIFEGLHVLDVGEGTPRGVAPTLELTGLGSAPVPVTIEGSGEAPPVPQRRGQRLEVGDSHFNLASSVFLPKEVEAEEPGDEEGIDAEFENDELWKELGEDLNDGENAVKNFKTLVHFPEDGGGGGSGGGPGAAAREQGLEVLLETLRFLRDHPDRKLVLTGHTDRAGPAAFNEELSRVRGEAVLSLLEGDRDMFLATCDAHNKPADDAAILRYMAASRGWPCDPGPHATRASYQNVLAFQQSFNQDFGQSIGEDGVVGRETRGAYFDVYMDDLATGLGGEQELAAARGQVAAAWIDPGQKVLACGERYPTEQPAVDGLVSEENRRIEVLFFEPSEVPSPLTPDGSAIYEAEPPFEFEQLELGPGAAPPDSGPTDGPDPPFQEKRETTPPLEGEEEIESEGEALFEEDAESPWFFLEPLALLDRTDGFGSAADTIAPALLRPFDANEANFGDLI